MRPDLAFRWTQKSLQAVTLIAQDKKTDLEIADTVGISKATLERWKQHPDFKERVADIVERFREAVLTQGIADRVNRVSAYHHRRSLMEQIMKERGESEEMKDVPGGKTGLLVKQHKMIGKGSEAHIVEEFAVDTALVVELRNIEKQAAQEVGQWTERTQQDLTSGGKPLNGIDLMGIDKLSDEELDRRIATAEARKATAGVSL